MERIDRDKKEGAFRAHCFPSIQGDLQKPDTSVSNFRPLFQTPSGNKGVHDKTACNNEEDDNKDNRLVAARKMSFDKGIRAGHMDACDMARKELEPSLNRFISGLNAFSDTYNLVSQKHSTQIMRLSLAIAQKIVGGDFHHDSDGMHDFIEALGDLLKRYYLLKVNLRKEDLGILTDLTNCRGIELKGIRAIHIGDNDAVQPGEPQQEISAFLGELHEHLNF